MSTLQLQLEDWDVHDQSTQDVVDELAETDRKAEYRYARTTDFRGTKVFRILDDFLQPDTETSLEVAVKAILEFIPDAPLSDEVALVGDIVLELAQQIPYHHPSQVKLARVMEGLTTSPKFISGPHSSGQYMRGQRFKESLRDTYNGPNGEFPQEWANLMAFYAHISAIHILPHDSTYAIWTMRDAFEERQVPWGPPFKGERNQRILAAAQFILWDGTELFKDVISPDLEDERPSWAPGLLCFSEHRLSIRRWHFWKDGFKKAAEESSGLSEECRIVAGKAARLMGAIEESLTF
ncbi:hypothetical protein BBP40_008430 [Aspergillus hancockii]|nr:hypothetical protein BBP40_008430 [Aspergillus hancockii]